MYARNRDSKEDVAFRLHTGEPVEWIAPELKNDKVIHTLKKDNENNISSDEVEKLIDLLKDNYVAGYLRLNALHTLQQLYPSDFPQPFNTNPRVYIKIGDHRKYCDRPHVCIFVGVIKNLYQLWFKMNLEKLKHMKFKSVEQIEEQEKIFLSSEAINAYVEGLPQYKADPIRAELKNYLTDEKEIISEKEELNNIQNHFIRFIYHG